MFSKACEYGIRASVYLVAQSCQGKKTGLKELAKAIDSPEAYTSKILQQLVRNNVIVSEKGPTGGFSIGKSDIDTLKLSKVVMAIDGDEIYQGCGLGFHHCDENQPCPIHHQFKAIRNDLKNMLETTTLLELSKDIKNGISFLKR
ncbi:MAG: Rrf2 family transcriptional regulator [Lentimicrobium sp.]|nr:Rrf2 family transcriptional regulator [Lentimicrobium sp.]MDD4597075.1 Rrf2 family transcriptional regulator [Lentimicrobiaceae bacterium]HAH56565.1 transcriptional regulator [Bacteroidales bacterium]